MSAPSPLRPRPVRDAFATVGSAVALLGSVVTALAGWGIVTAVEGDALTGLLGAVPAAVTAVTAVMVAFGVVHRAEPQVTPVQDPALLVGGRLVALVADRGATRD